MSADLSVVICSLNGAPGVERCLRALAEQKDVELEIIVVDDGSTDDTSEVGREHGATVIRHEVNRGPGGGSEHWCPGRRRHQSWRSWTMTASPSPPGRGSCLTRTRTA